MAIEYTNIPTFDGTDTDQDDTDSDQDDTGGDSESRWAPAAILRRLDHTADLNDNQQATVTTAVRNPYAGVSQIAEAVGLTGPSLVANTMWRLKLGGYDDDDTTDHHPALNEGTPAFRDRTLKQRAAIHYLATRPKAFDVLTYKQVAEQCQARTGVSMHWKTVYDAYQNYPGLIAERRDRLDDAAIEPVREDERVDHRAGSEVPVKRQLLEAGITELPDENLDLDPIWEVVDVSRARAMAAVSDASSSDGSADGTDDTTPTSDDTVSDASTTTDGAAGSAAGSDADTTAATDTATDAASAAGRAAGRDGSRGDDDGVTDRRAGNARYKGPATGLDLTSGRAAKTLVDRARDDAGDELADAIAQVQDEDGVLGEHAYRRAVDLESREDVENEIRRLRMLVAAQGEMLQAFREVLDGLSVSVSLECDVPDEVEP